MVKKKSSHCKNVQVHTYILLTFIVTRIKYRMEKCLVLYKIVGETKRLMYKIGTVCLILVVADFFFIVPLSIHLTLRTKL